MTDERIGLLHLSIAFAQRAIERFGESWPTHYYVSRRRGVSPISLPLQHCIRAVEKVAYRIRENIEGPVSMMLLLLQTGGAYIALSQAHLGLGDCLAGIR